MTGARPRKLNGNPRHLPKQWPHPAEIIMNKNHTRRCSYGPERDHENRFPEVESRAQGAMTAFSRIIDFMGGRGPPAWKLTWGAPNEIY